MINTQEPSGKAGQAPFEAIQRVLAVKPIVWDRVYRSGGLSPMESDLIQLFGLRQGKIPTERQAGALLRMLERAADAGAIPRDSY